MPSWRKPALPKARHEARLAEYGAAQTWSQSGWNPKTTSVTKARIIVAPSPRPRSDGSPIEVVGPRRAWTDSQRVPLRQLLRRVGHPVALDPTDVMSVDESYPMLGRIGVAGSVIPDHSVP